MAFLSVRPLCRADRKVSRKIPVEICRAVQTRQADRFRHRLSLANARNQSAAGREAVSGRPRRHRNGGVRRARQAGTSTPAAAAAICRTARLLVWLAFSLVHDEFRLTRLPLTSPRRGGGGWHLKMT